MLTIMPQLSLAAQFGSEHTAQNAYKRINNQLRGTTHPLSVFRFEDQGWHYVAVVGEEEDMVVWQRLAHLMLEGEVLTLDDATIDGLFAKRATQSQ